MKKLLVVLISLISFASYAHPNDQDSLTKIGVNTTINTQYAIDIPANIATLVWENSFVSFTEKTDLRIYGNPACQINLAEIVDYERRMSERTFRITEVKQSGMSRVGSCLRRKVIRLKVDDNSIHSIHCWGRQVGCETPNGYEPDPTIGQFKQSFAIWGKVQFAPPAEF